MSAKRRSFSRRSESPAPFTSSRSTRAARRSRASLEDEESLEEIVAMSAGNSKKRAKSPAATATLRSSKSVRGAYFDDSESHEIEDVLSPIQDSLESFAAEVKNSGKKSATNNSSSAKKGRERPPTPPLPETTAQEPVQREARRGRTSYIPSPVRMLANIPSGLTPLRGDTLGEERRVSAAEQKARALEYRKRSLSPPTSRSSFYTQEYSLFVCTYPNIAVLTK